MVVEVTQESAEALEDYARVGIAFTVERRYRVESARNGLGRLILVEEEIAPYVKDYDVESGGPISWRGRWDVSEWGFLAAFEQGRRVGGAVIAWKTDELVITGNREETAILWDLRVDEPSRRAGVGSRLFAEAEAWSRARFCRRLEVETQNTNVPACKFYSRQGCELIAIDRRAYARHPDEVRLVWEKNH
jgi:GNAT superfamily N-acetyltransferase